MARHESAGTLQQFFETGDLGPSTPEEAIKNTKNLPLASFDKGFGIFQLTSGPPSITQIWSWKANIDEAKRRINGFLVIAKQKMNEYYELAKKALVEGSIDKIPEIPSITYSKVTFKDPWVYPNYDKTFIHAIAIKRYNGIATEIKENGEIKIRNLDFVVWDVENSKWEFFPINKYKVNYVQAVCNKY